MRDDHRRAGPFGRFDIAEATPLLEGKTQHQLRSPVIIQSDGTKLIEPGSGPQRCITSRSGDSQVL